jgi:hypothetical protein
VLAAGALSSLCALALAVLAAGALSSLCALALAVLAAGAFVAGAFVLAGAVVVGLALVALVVFVFGASPPHAEINKAADATVVNVNTLMFIFLSLPLKKSLSNLFEQLFTNLLKQVRNTNRNFAIVKSKMKKNG